MWNFQGIIFTWKGTNVCVTTFMSSGFDIIKKLLLKKYKTSIVC